MQFPGPRRGLICSQAFWRHGPRAELLEQLAGPVDWVGSAGCSEGLFELGGVGRGPVDSVMLYESLLLERLCNVSDSDAVWMVRDALSFRPFLGVGAGDQVPDETTLSTR